jgi:hypothetical protein
MLVSRQHETQPPKTLRVGVAGCSTGRFASVRLCSCTTDRYLSRAEDTAESRPYANDSTILLAVRRIASPGALPRIRRRQRDAADARMHRFARSVYGPALAPLQRVMRGSARPEYEAEPRFCALPASLRFAYYRQIDFSRSHACCSSYLKSARRAHTPSADNSCSSASARAWRYCVSADPSSPLSASSRPSAVSA